MKRILAAAASVAILGTSCAAFQPRQNSRHVVPSSVTPPFAGRRTPSLSLRMNPTSSSVTTATSGMETYDAALKRAYSAASYNSLTQASGPGGLTAAVSRNELQTTTDALNAALDKLKNIREMIGSGSAVPGGQTQQNQNVGAGQKNIGPQVQMTTPTPGQLRLETTEDGPMVPAQRRPTILRNSASSTARKTPYKQNQNIRPLRPPTPGTNIDVDRMVNPAVDTRYLPTASQARRMAKTESNRAQAAEAFGRGSVGFYGRRYGVWDSTFGYGPWSGAYGGNYYYGSSAYGGYGYYNPGFTYGPYSYGYDPFVLDYGAGNYYGDGRRNAYLWGSQRRGPDYYADTVEFAEGQKEMDKEQGRAEYARRREWQERRMRGESMLPPGQDQQMQPIQQQQQQGEGQATSPSGTGTANPYLNSMGGRNNVSPQQHPLQPLQPQQLQMQGPQASPVPQAAASAATTTTNEEKPKEKRFSYLESDQQDSANTALPTSQQANPNANVGTADAPYAEAEQMPLRPSYDRYNTSYSDSRYNNPAFAAANGSWDPYFGYSNFGRYGYNIPYNGGGGGYGGVRGGDWFSEQIRRSEREKVYDAQARSRLAGSYGFYGGYGRNSWSDFTFAPASYI